LINDLPELMSGGGSVISYFLRPYSNHKEISDIIIVNKLAVQSRFFWNEDFLGLLMDRFLDLENLMQLVNDTR